MAEKFGRPLYRRVKELLSPIIPAPLRQTRRRPRRKKRRNLFRTIRGGL